MCNETSGFRLQSYFGNATDCGVPTFLPVEVTGLIFITEVLHIIRYVEKVGREDFAFKQPLLGLGYIGVVCASSKCLFKCLRNCPFGIKFVLRLKAGSNTRRYVCSVIAATTFNSFENCWLLRCFLLETLLSSAIAIRPVRA
jgi:hypothetical protein